MTVTHYMTEDKDGKEVHYYGEGIHAYDEAKADAQRDKLRVIEVEYEFSDSSMIEDYTEEPAEE